MRRQQGAGEREYTRLTGLESFASALSTINSHGKQSGSNLLEDRHKNERKAFSLHVHVVRAIRKLVLLSHFYFSTFVEPE